MPIRETEARNKAAVRQYLEEVWNHGDLEAADEIIARTFVFHGPAGATEGIEAFKQYLTYVHSISPDIHFTTDDLIVEEDRVVACWTMSGTQEKEFMGIPATGNHYTIPGVSILRLSRGKLAEAQLFWDRQSLVEQLRAAPVPR